MITDNKEVMALQKLESNIRHFQSEFNYLAKIFAKAKKNQHHQFAVDTKKAMDGISGILGFLNSAHSQLTEKYTRVPIINLDAPRLKLVVDNTKEV